ncbi:50S ribosomal protein L18e [Candidatus Woesearchaeota archaeon]|nr:50S ribosomal protein L18e [Candidatus Woesearchaeota archaeon]
MGKRTGPTTLELKKLIADLKSLSTKEKVKVWKAVARYLESPTRQRREVNLYKIDKYSKEGEFIVVPGKILSQGDLNKKVTVAAYRFSEKAKEKINKLGKAILIQQLMKDNPKGKKVRILG